ncbi:hypothetical protein GN156_15450 [bacterium LRH843]|nr:hypothetical protein [bacterium LRH843]
MIGTNIFRLRKLKGMSQHQLGQLVNLEQTLISRMVDSRYDLSDVKKAIDVVESSKGKVFLTSN